MPARVELRKGRVRRRLRLHRPRAELQGEPLLAPVAQDREPHLRARRLLADRFHKRLNVLDLDAVERNKNVARLEPRRIRRPARNGLHHLRAARPLPAERIRLLFRHVRELNAEPARGRLLRPRAHRQHEPQGNHSNRNPAHGRPQLHNKMALPSYQETAAAATPALAARRSSCSAAALTAWRRRYCAPLSASGRRDAASRPSAPSRAPSHRGSTRQR